MESYGEVISEMIQQLKTKICRMSPADSIRQSFVRQDRLFIKYCRTAGSMSRPSSHLPAWAKEEKHSSVFIFFKKKKKTGWWQDLWPQGTVASLQFPNNKTNGFLLLQVARGPGAKFCLYRGLSVLQGPGLQHPTSSCCWYNVSVSEETRLQAEAHLSSPQRALCRKASLPCV